MMHWHTSNRFTWRDLILFAAVFWMVATVYTGATRRDKSYREADHIACTRIEVLKAGFRDSFEENRRGLDKIDYYKLHPYEKALAEKSIDHELKRYAPSKC